MRLRRRFSWALLAVTLLLLGLLVVRRTKVLPQAFRSVALQPAEVISPAEAIHHVGRRAQVCGVVASAHFAADSRGSPTFLNLDAPYPNQIFTAVIWIETRSRFTRPPEALRGERVCVSGTVAAYKSQAEIIVRDPAQIVVMQTEATEPQEAGVIEYGGKKYRVFSDGRRELAD